MSATTLDDAWELTPADGFIIGAKRWGSRLRLAVMLLFSAHEAASPALRPRWMRARELDHGVAATDPSRPGEH